jgi:RNA polymerase sigma-70 factor (ECF subfamily)
MLPARRHEDRELRDRVVRGERGAAAQLLERHLEALYEFVHYRLGADRAAVEDVVQDTFVAAFEGLPRFDGRSSLHTWLCSIAKHKLHRARRARRPESLEELLERADPEIDALLARIEIDPIPEDVLEREETRELVGATLSSLPPEYREALLAKYVEGLDVAALAARTGRGAKATESRLQRARVAFARVFALLAKKRGGLA